MKIELITKYKVNGFEFEKLKDAQGYIENIIGAEVINKLPVIHHALKLDILNMLVKNKNILVSLLQGLIDLESVDKGEL